MLYEGAYGRIISTGENTVKKVPHRKVPKGSLSLDDQKSIHAAILEETSSYTILRAPRLIRSDDYEMERINIDSIIFLGCQGIVKIQSNLLISELARLWIALCKRGYLAWDFELYLQPDGSVVIVDFDKFKTGSPHEGFFIHPCFPKGFKKMVGQ